MIIHVTEVLVIPSGNKLTSDLYTRIINKIENGNGEYVKETTTRP